MSRSITSTITRATDIFSTRTLLQCRVLISQCISEMAAWHGTCLALLSLFFPFFFEGHKLCFYS